MAEKPEEKKEVEIKYLEGPRPRLEELLFTIKVVFQFIKGFRALHFVGPCITIFGSAQAGLNLLFICAELGESIS